MVWWQYLVVSIVPMAVGALLGYWLNRLGAKNERAMTEQRQLQDAARGLLVEMHANLKLTESPELTLLPPLAKDMWNMHKSKVAELPLEIQESLYQVYSGIDKVNDVVQLRHDFSSMPGHGPGAWDRRYKNEAEKARGLMEKVRDDLESYLGK